MPNGSRANSSQSQGSVGPRAVALAHLLRPDARHFAGLYRVEDRGFFRRELEGVAVTAGDEHGATASLLCQSRRGEKIVGLVAGTPGIGEPAGGDKFRNQFKLLDELVVEIAAALIRRKSLVPVGLRFERIPADSTARGRSVR